MKKFAPASFDLLPHMHPHIRISPFTPSEWKKLLSAKISSRSTVVETPKFWLDGGRDIQFFKSGRDALLMCLLGLGLKRSDEILIVKNTDGPYITGCVTKTIERVCRWSLAIEHKPPFGFAQGRRAPSHWSLLLVIHEFGFPCPAAKVAAYRRQGIPILEDCAYALGSRIEGAAVGTFGDFALYSLPKYLPVPLGGILISKSNLKTENAKLRISLEEKDLLTKTLQATYPLMTQWNKTRQENWKFFAQALAQKGFRPYFPLRKNIVPGVYLASVPKNFRGEVVKKRLNDAGVESTQYYRQNGFYFPVHQFLTDWEKEYILKNFLAAPPHATL